MSIIKQESYIYNDIIRDSKLVIPENYDTHKFEFDRREDYVLLEIDGEVKRLSTSANFYTNSTNVKFIKYERESLGYRVKLSITSIKYKEIDMQKIEAYVIRLSDMMALYLGTIS